MSLIKTTYTPATLWNITTGIHLFNVKIWISQPLQNIVFMCVYIILKIISYDVSCFLSGWALVEVSGGCDEGGNEEAHSRGCGRLRGTFAGTLGLGAAGSGGSHRLSDLVVRWHESCIWAAGRGIWDGTQRLQQETGQSAICIQYCTHYQLWIDWTNYTE